MSKREQRLQADHALMMQEFSSHRYIAVVGTSGTPPDRYEIEYRLNGLEKAGDDVCIRQVHRMEAVLSKNYPAEAPQCRMLTPVFHPNMADDMIFITDYWMSVGSLCALIVRIGEMIAYQRYDIGSALNSNAARWAARNRDRLPADTSVIAHGKVPDESPRPSSSSGDGKKTAAPPAAGREREYGEAAGSSDAGTKRREETAGRKAPEVPDDGKKDMSGLNITVTLEVRSGPDRGRVYTFIGPRTLFIGRGGPNHHVDICIPPDDPYVSRRHCSLDVAPPQVMLRDLGSVNPPLVNGVDMREGTVYSGDILQVGFTELAVTIGNGRREVSGDTPAAQSLPSAAVLPEKPQPHYLCRCGTDCSTGALRDGLAAELDGIVTYLCSECAERETEEEALNIGPYQVLNTLGMGGMGVVYRVYHRDSARILAIKQVLNLYANHEIIRRFEREVRYLQNLIHPSILRFIDSGSTEEGPYLAMEFARRGNLETLMTENDGKLPVAQAVSLVLQCLDGLMYMHEKGIIHRDVKPENILLQENTHGDIVPKLADFGLAKNYLNTGGSQLTHLGARIGSLLYMPPEQFRDAATVREPADTYAMGVTLYYLITGEYPYEFPTPHHLRDIMNRQRLSSPQDTVLYLTKQRKMLLPDELVRSEEPIPVTVRNPSVPADLASVVDRAVRKDQEERYSTAGEMKRELEECAGKAAGG